MHTILLGLNELNFKFVEKYIQLGYLPNFKKLFTEYGYIETTSEQEYSLLEPWIQWVTIHTGKTYAEHQVFRLGDIVERPELTQIFELLEDQGYRIGAVSPFNADNRLKNPAFFIPDPWTKTQAAGNFLIKNIAQAISQAVNDNAQGKLSTKSLISLLTALIYYTPINDCTWYGKRLSELKKNVATKALILDKLLSDIFIKEWKKTRPDFSLLFLNSAAHLQHHYLFNSGAYTGNLKNPEWYCAANQDPILAIYQLYDAILARVQQLPNVRLIVATGLSQQPHEELTFYWRLKEHKQFLHAIGIDNFTVVYPRMSRDFLIEFATPELAEQAQEILKKVKATDGENIFFVDNRNTSLFVELIYPYEISDDLNIIIDNITLPKFKQYVAFVALKNGEHNAIGYYIDSARLTSEKRIPITQVHINILKGFNSVNK
ncbi:MAG: hypothetical protein ACHP9Y_00145 [Gammaproteobacteria bacterium]